MTENFDLVVRARQALVDGALRTATLGVRDGRIVAIADVAPDWSATEDVTLAEDEVLIPGIVDTHVHVNEPGRTEWEGFATATKAALAGGATTIVDMPLNSLPPTCTVAALEEKKRAAQGRTFVDVGFWGGAIPGNKKDLAGLHEAGVFGFKCFLIDSGVPEFPPLSPTELRDYLEETARLGALMIVHAEDAEAIDAAPQVPGPEYGNFVASRPPQAEITAIQHVIDAVRATGARAHILHLSAADALPLIRDAKAEGLPITVETCPHYLTFTAETIPDGATTHKCCPPIRDDANRDALWAALADGTIDIVVSDHSPCTAELKKLNVGDFADAWGGIAGLEVAFRATWTEARRRGHALPDVVRWMSTGPADLVGLTDRGRLAVDARADLAVLAPDENFDVHAGALHHKNKVSAYDGLHLRGGIRRTWIDGRPARLDTPSGEFVTRGTTR